MRIHVHRTERGIATALADRLADALRVTPGLVLGLPTGRTPVQWYREIARRVEHGQLDLSRITTFNLDEFIGLAPDHPGSYRQFMERHLFAHAGIPPERINFLRGDAPDVEAECARYECSIAEAGGIDLMVLGIGRNGHIGFNEPGAELYARSHRATLTHDTRRSNAELFGGSVDAVPREALSMGMATILQSRAIVLVATGRSKAAVVQAMRRGRITTQLPASFLQLHADVDVYVDDGAGG